MTRDEFLIAVGSLRGLYPRSAEMTPAQASAWWKALGCARAADFTSAIDRYYTTDATGRAPTLGQICGLIVSRIDDTPEDKAIYAPRTASQGCVTGAEWDEFNACLTLCQEYHAVGLVKSVREVTDWMGARLEEALDEEDRSPGHLLGTLRGIRATLTAKIAERRATQTKPEGAA